jgi:tetratricopeptide (TPR) repeat protein
VLRKLGKFEDAIAVIDVAVAVDPNKEFLWHQKGLCFERLNQENEAQRCYEKAVQLDSTCSSLHFHYGLLLYQKDEFAAALREFDNALKAEPSEEDYLLWKARALHKTDSLDDARRIVNRLLTINEKNADAWFVLAQLAPDDSQQLPLFQKVLKLQPGHPGALCSSAACLSNLGNYEEALAIFRRMQEVCPRHQMCDILITNTCTTLAKLGRTEEGITQVEELLLIAPTHAGALSAKAICLTAAGKSSEAFSLYQHALTLHPNNTTLWYNQACLFASKRKVRESIRCLQKAISIDGSYLATMKADHDFDPIRNRKTFKVAFHHN